MATNVNLSTANFCNSPRASDEYCNIYDDGGTDYFQIMDNNGPPAQLGPWSLDTTINTVESFEYVGPRGVSSILGDLLPFFTLEHITNSHCRIREWRLNSSNSSLDIHNTIDKVTNSGVEHFNCYSMSVEWYETEFDAATITGSGKIKLATFDNVEVGDKLLLGPSDSIGYVGDYEWVTVTNVDSTWVYLSSGEPQSAYRDSNPITYYKNIYLFSDIGSTGDETRGALYKLNPYNGSVKDVIDRGIYSGIRASAWCPAYQAVAFVKANNLMYSTISGTYQINRSQVLPNQEANEYDIIPVYDLVFDGSSIYRLQTKRTLVDDDGLKATEDWGSYNYHQDTIAPYTKNIDISASPAGIVVNSALGVNNITLTAVVRDQFGVGLQNQNVAFSRNGDAAGSFNPLNGQVLTDSNGVASIIYTTGIYNLPFGGNDNEDVIIKAVTDGASSLTGSQYVCEYLNLLLVKKFTTELLNLVQKPTLSGTWPTEGSELYQDTTINQIEDYEITMGVPSKSKFQFPGGDWVGDSKPNDETTKIKQVVDFDINIPLNQRSSEIDNELHLNQDKDHENDLQLSQVYVSRHVLGDHQDDVDIDQFRFIEDAVPAFWSYKNPTSTYIWIRLRPFAFSLNQSTLVFKVKEVSYAGDTGYVDVTSQCVVSTFSAGGELLGLDITYNPSSSFHHNATVYVSIEVYDTAPLPNIVVTDYWFKIIPDFKAPYIDNEDPEREEMDVLRNNNISFDVYDAGAGVDISTLELYVNNRLVTPVTSIISGGYHVLYNPPRDFYYGQAVEVTVKIKDVSDAENSLYDMWRFFVEGSTGPWIDLDSFVPPNCTKGVSRSWSPIEFNIYAINDTGLDRGSIIVYIGGKKRAVTITPIVYRET